MSDHCPCSFGCLPKSIFGFINFSFTYLISLDRYPDPLIKVNDTVKVNIETGKVVEFIKFDIGNIVMVTGGRNRGRIGVIQHREKHKGSFDIIHVTDAVGHQFATRMGNVFTIGKGTKPWISLPRGKGIKLSIVDEARKHASAAKVAA